VWCIPYPVLRELPDTAGAVEAVEGTILTPEALAMLGLPLHPVLIMPFL
jgi:hypothetical protein